MRIYSIGINILCKKPHFDLFNRFVIIRSDNNTARVANNNYIII